MAGGDRTLPFSHAGQRGIVFAAKVGKGVSPCVARSTTVVAQKMTKWPPRLRSRSPRIVVAPPVLPVSEAPTVGCCNQQAR